MPSNGLKRLFNEDSLKEIWLLHKVKTGEKCTKEITKQNTEIKNILSFAGVFFGRTGSQV
jgi:hypothetical protein